MMLIGIVIVNAIPFEMVLNAITGVGDVVRSTNQSGVSMIFDNVTIENNLVVLGSGNISKFESQNITTIDIVTYNVTSPYVNKSYISFFDDGSVGITLDP